MVLGERGASACRRCFFIALHSLFLSFSPRPSFSVTVLEEEEDELELLWSEAAAAAALAGTSSARFLPLLPKKDPLLLPLLPLLLLLLESRFCSFSSSLSRSSSQTNGASFPCRSFSGHARERGSHSVRCRE